MRMHVDREEPLDSGMIIEQEKETPFHYFWMKTEGIFLV